MKKTITIFALLLYFSIGGNLIVQAEETPISQQPQLSEAITPVEATPTPKVVSPAPRDAEQQNNMELLYFEDVKVLVASGAAEPLKDAPVITNVVSAKQIKRMGARTLNDILLTIPGFTMTQDHNEYFSAMRGIYASSQQKILVLRDGHRMNARSYSEANFDYSISLENIDRVEIMRGPGGSLYGDVALTAVINLVTKSAEDVDGIEATIGYGNFSQLKGSVLYGKKFSDQQDILFSGAIYENSGETKDWEDPRDPGVVGEGVVYGFAGRPSYDIYLKYNLLDFQILASSRYGNYIEPATGAGATGLIYDLDSALIFKDLKPGLSSQMNHFEINHHIEFGNSMIRSKLFADTFTMDANMGVDPTTNTRGNLFWNDWVGGGQVEAHLADDAGTGNLLLGISFERMEVYESEFHVYSPSGRTYPGWGPGPNQVLLPGKEMSYSFFLQDKHRITPNLIANLGLRFDYKQRRPHETEDVDDVQELSPRTALIWTIIEDLQWRVSYSHSFVDAPYWYRYNSIPSYQGAVNLRPEELDSLQTSIELDLLDKQLIQSINFFYNDMNDVVFRNLAGLYSNAGYVRTRGIEYEVAYNKKDLSVRANYTYQYLQDAEGYSVQDNRLESVPQHTGNLLIDIAPMSMFSNMKNAEDIWLHLSARYIGSQYSRWGKGLTDPADSVDAAFLLNAGVTWDNIYKSLSLSLHGYNLADSTHYQGGSVNYPHVQPGRWFLGKVSYDF